MARTTSGKVEPSHGGEGCANTARQVYEVTGDASAALTLLEEEEQANHDAECGVDPSFYEYHESLLKACGTFPVNQGRFHPLLEDSSSQPEDTTDKSSFQAKRQRVIQERIRIYNRGLVLFTMGKLQESMELIFGVLQPFILSGEFQKTKKHPKYALVVACRLAFLWLEGYFSNMNNTNNNPQLDAVTRWLNKTLDHLTESQLQQDGNLYESKFLWSLYKSRLDFLDRHEGKLVDSKMRSARKELKQAMETFQHKLRPTTSDGFSLASGDSTSQSNGRGADSHLSSSVLQGQNQAALNLKANTEQVKGNVKKSLTLCSEAYRDKDDPTYEPLHWNNLAIVYSTSKAPHLALHAWSKALQSSCTSGFASDGTARPNENAHLKILHNAAIGSLQAQKWEAAYACLATCLEQSPSIWRQRPRSWLRLVEACIGMSVDLFMY